MTDRDHFAAAALGGLISLNCPGPNQQFPQELCERAYRWADAMLRERGNHPAKPDSSANHDAAPAARADLPDERPPNAVSANGGTPCAASRDGSGTGKQPAPPCVETDGFSSGSRTGQINRTPERESPRQECGGNSLRDVARPDTKGKVAGGPEHHISEAEIDALEFVVEEGRIANIHDYGILRSLLIRLRQEWEFSDSPEPTKDAGSDRSEAIAPTMLVNGVDRPVSYAKSDEKRIFYDTKSPRNGALSGCEAVPDPDSRVWKTPCTPQPHAAPQQGSVQGDGSFLDSRNANEPVAWAVAGDYGEYAVKLCFDEASAVLEADRRCRVGLRPDYVVVPLYRQPPDWAFLNDEIARLRDAIRRLAEQDATLSVCNGNVTVTMDATLTDEEREAVEEMLHLIATRQTDYQREAHTLRKLLERLK